MAMYNVHDVNGTSGRIGWLQNLSMYSLRTVAQTAYIKHMYVDKYALLLTRHSVKSGPALLLRSKRIQA